MSVTVADYRRVRADTEALASPLSAEDCCVQSMAEASPAKWHLAHTTWFFETFVLERFEPDFRPFDASFRILFNSYYHTIGQQHPRPQRGLVTRPGLERVREFRRAVDERMERLLSRPEGAAAATPLVTLGLHHEQQHQELMLTDIKHLFSFNPMHPAYLATYPAGPSAAPPLGWHAYAGGTSRIGHDGGGFGFDNEQPRHVVWLEPFELGSRLTVNAEFLEFIADGGYATPQHWLSDGWDWLQAGQSRHPCYWQHRPEGWFEFTLAGLQPLDPARPVVHVSYYEADAYARWAGARLPSEAEWEVAASALPVNGHFADRGQFHPAAAGDSGLSQIFGDAWEWTSTAYAAYPGFRAAPGAVGEYNGKFMVNQYVLRGGSCATPSGHMRASYRNFFPAAATWQFSGIRLAR